VADTLRAELNTLLAEKVKDPRVATAGYPAVSQVRISDDLGHARVLVSFIGGDEKAIPGAIASLQKMAGFLGGEAGRRLGMRRAPQLTFAHDQSAEHLAKIDRLLKGDDE
jgi:ribosome-binding factor A